MSNNVSNTVYGLQHDGMTPRVAAAETYRSASRPRSRIPAWDRPSPVATVVSPAAGFIAAEVGVVLVALMAWLVLFVVR